MRVFVLFPVGQQTHNVNMDDEALIEAALAEQAHAPERLQNLAYPVVIAGRVHWRSAGPSSCFTQSPAMMHRLEQVLRSGMHLPNSAA